MSVTVQRVLIIGLTAALLAACDAPTESSSSADAPVDIEVPAEPASPPAYVGTWAFDPVWCTDQTDGFPVTLTATRLEGWENRCDMTNITSTPEGGWTADLTCTAEGTEVQERLAMTPIGEQLALNWLDRPGAEATLFTRCP